MAHIAKDGSKWSNLSQKMAADRKFGAVPVPGRDLGTGGKQPIPASKFPKPVADRKPSLINDKPAPDDSEQTQDPSQVIEQHGPAQTVTIEHQGDQHTVRSTHADGHEHSSKHSSAEEAHQAAKTLSGVDEQADDTQELPNLADVMR